MNYTLKELLDITHLRELLESLDEIIGMPSAILDTEGTILIASSWQDICTKFHRIHPETKKKCIESDLKLEAGVADNAHTLMYCCPMGLIDAALPVVLEGKHLGNVFVGQLFIEPPVEAYFIDQARLYGFDETGYLEALRNVPVFTEEQVRKNLSFIGSLVNFLAEQGLQHKRQLEAEEKYRNLYQNATIGIFHSTFDDKFIDVNPAVARILGYDSPEEVISSVTSISEQVYAVPSERIANASIAMEAGGTVCIENLYRHKDGTLWNGLLNLRIIFDQQGRPSHFEGFVEDVTDRKQAEEALKKSEEKFSRAFKASPEIIVITSMEDGTYIEVNDAFLEKTGLQRDEVIGHTSTELNFWINLDERKLFLENLTNNGFLRNYEVRYRMKSDEERDFLVSSEIVDIDGKQCSLNYITDITERKRAEEDKLELELQLLQAKKLESLGVLAGGIAHDFNNILAVIIGHCSLATLRPKSVDEHIKQIENAAERAADLCRQMLAYAGKAQFVQNNVNMGELVEEMIHMLQATIGKNVAFKQYISPHVTKVIADASQIRQVIMNLVINASEAIGEEQGEIFVSLEQVAIRSGQSDKDYLGVRIPAGKYLCLEVTDNGCGMDDETKQRIFEPFYSTKFTGRGLGMSAVLGILSSHKGALQLFSQPEQGTIIKVYLPLESSDSAGDEPAQPSTSAMPWHGSGTVLLVEDEEQIVLIAKTMLEELGFTVIVALNGKEALELYQENADDITLVVTDIGLPVMDGYSLFRELKLLDPDLPIIVSSGFGDSVVTSRIDQKDIAGLVSKPYTYNTFRDVLKNVIMDVLQKQE